MNIDSIFIIAEQENHNFYRAIPLREQRVELHPLDCSAHPIHRGDPVLFLIDCGFDERRGLALLHECKTNRPDIPVILITDAGSEDTAVRAFRLGARDYFRKPVDLFALKWAIENVLMIKRTSSEKRVPLGTANPDATPRCSLPAASEIPQNLLRVITYVEKHLAEQLTIDHLAGEAGVSRFHFCRIFKKTLKTSPMSFLALMRIERAKALLRNNTPVSTVALKVGYNDLSNFSRQFRKFTGMTPTIYRDSLKQ
ncbi:MAG: two component AraC family transcriptional [Geobacteraceae bacterium]|nr:MAG: two component AraC family transcriptional [Geobacteraceae bacterium]